MQVDSLIFADSFEHLRGNWMIVPRELDSKWNHIFVTRKSLSLPKKAKIVVELYDCESDVLRRNHPGDVWINTKLTIFNSRNSSRGCIIGNREKKEVLSQVLYFGNTLQSLGLHELGKLYLDEYNSNKLSKNI